MATTTSLLRSASAARKRVIQQEDNIQAYIWESSAQTYDDFAAYSKYLDDRQQATSDPGDALTYQSKLRTARRSFVSNEIQREQMRIYEGGGTTETKLAAIQNLYQQAAAAGDFNLAQNLAAQWESLSIQNQKEKQSYASSLASTRSANVDDAIDTVKGYIQDVSKYFQDLGPTEFKKQISAYASELGLDANADFFDIQHALATQAVQVVDQAIQSASTEKEAKSLMKKRDTIVNGNAFELPDATGGTIKVSLQDLANQIDAARVGETVFQEAGNGFIKNQKTGFVWGRDENGNYRQIPLYNPGQNFDSAVDNGLGGVYSYQDLLKKAGLKEGQDIITKDGTIYIRNRGDLKGIDNNQFPVGTFIPLQVSNDGRLIASAGDKAFVVDFDNNGEFRGFTNYNPSAITQVNGTNARFNNNYLATQDLNKYGVDKGSLVGIVDRAQAGRNIPNIAQFSSANTSRLLDNASTILQNNVALQAPPQTIQRTAAPIVQAPAPQQTLNPFNLPPVPQLKVSAPIVTPRITSVGVASPQQKLSVTAPPPTPRIRF